MDAVLLVISFGVIVGGAELFTNGVEWLGRKLELSEGAVGSVFAAIGTALPETMIPVVAIIFGGSAATRDVGVGAVLGAPFMLGTGAMAVTGLVVLAARRRRVNGERLQINPSAVAHDVRTFLVAYAGAVALALLPASLVAPRAAGAVVLIGVYLWYARRHLGTEAEEDAERPEPLRFHRLDRRRHRLNPHEPHVRIVAVQVVVALAIVVVGATLFVDGAEGIGAAFGVNELLFALLVAPIATELPEAVNAVIWVRQGKDTLAIGNITGAMVFQATIPTSIALMFAPAGWVVGQATLLAFLSVPVVILSVALIVVPMVRSGGLGARALLGSGGLYLGYLLLVVLAETGVLRALAS